MPNFLFSFLYSLVLSIDTCTGFTSLQMYASAKYIITDSKELHDSDRVQERKKMEVCLKMSVAPCNSILGTLVTRQNVGFSESFRPPEQCWHSLTDNAHHLILQQPDMQW
eukprot:GHUV01052854.1.p1 GENE.GHUV01052854.1~~GHUV01052854.1.p1  ORF type:complete len:110 (-),score=10.35 GHUV01052854.1:78-407(-)